MIIIIIRVAVGKWKLFWFCEARAKLNVLERAVAFPFFRLWVTTRLW